MTREQAQQLINNYCDDIPADEPAAVRRLMDYHPKAFAMIGTGAALGHRQQDELDSVIYAEGVADPL